MSRFRRRHRQAGASPPGRARRSRRSTAPTFPTAAGGRGRAGNALGLGLPAEEHGHAPVGIPLDDHVAHLVHGPDVVLGIDPYDVSKHKAVQTLPDEAEEVPVLVEFE